MALSKQRPDCALALRAHLDEELGVCGDSGLIKEVEGELFIALLDALGHGSEAHAVAVRAIKYLSKASQKKSLPKILQGLHKHLKGTRCVVVTLCRFNYKTGVLKYAGVGNISAKIYAPTPITLLPREGVVGYIMSTPREETLTLSPGSLLVLHSDGIPSHINMDEALCVKESTAKEIAERLISKFGKDDDDVSCLTLKV